MRACCLRSFLFFYPCFVSRTIFLHIKSPLHICPWMWVCVHEGVWVWVCVSECFWERERVCVFCVSVQGCTCIDPFSATRSHLWVEKLDHFLNVEKSTDGFKRKQTRDLIFSQFGYELVHSWARGIWEKH